METDLLMAPMMDVTTPSYILLRKHFGGVGMYTLPMVFVNQIVAAPKTIKPFAEFIEKNRPSGIQICGSGRSLEDIKKAIEILNSYDFDLIDINSGCPARHTCNSGGGASLMKPHRHNDLKNLIHTTIKFSNKPVSVKIRTGWDSKEGLKETVEMIENENPIFLTVHGRTAKQNYSGIVDLEAIRKVVNWVDIPVIGNGDIYSYKTYKIMKETTGISAVMIGRSTMENPKLFSEINNEGIIDINISDELKEISTIPIEFSHKFKENHHKINKSSDIKNYINILLDFINGMDKYWNNERFKVIELRRNIIWMLKGVFNSAKIREKIGKTRELNILLDYINSDVFYNDLDPNS